MFRAGGHGTSRLPTPFGHGARRRRPRPPEDQVGHAGSTEDRIASHRSPLFRQRRSSSAGTYTHEDLIAYYHAVIYAVGAHRNYRRMGIPLSTCRGHHSATESWAGKTTRTRTYFPVPAVRPLRERAVVVGNGKRRDGPRPDPRHAAGEDLAQTDIAEHALEPSPRSRIREIIVLGRRGPAQAAFTPPRNSGSRPHHRVARSSSTPRRAALSTRSAPPRVARACGPHPRREPRGARRLRGPDPHRGRPAGGAAVPGPRRWRSSEPSASRRSSWPATSCTAGGRPAARPHVRPDRGDPGGPGVPGHRLPGVPLPGIPFDAMRGVIPNQVGRITDPVSGHVIPGEYVVGGSSAAPRGSSGPTSRTPTRPSTR